MTNNVVSNEMTTNNMSLEHSRTIRFDFKCLSKAVTLTTSVLNTAMEFYLVFNSGSLIHFKCIIFTTKQC